MKKQLLGGCLSALVIGVVALTAAANAWQYETIGRVSVRRHLLTGMVQLQSGKDWKPAFTVDPQAEIVPQSDLDTVTFTDITWGSNDLLTGNAVTKPGKPIRGRLSLVIQIQERQDGSVKNIKDRALRQTVDWVAGQPNAFVLATGLPHPVRKQTTKITLENVR